VYLYTMSNTNKHTMESKFPHFNFTATNRTNQNDVHGMTYAARTIEELANQMPGTIDATKLRYQLKSKLNRARMDDCFEYYTTFSFSHKGYHMSFEINHERVWR
jgi:hypothetical protein